MAKWDDEKMADLTRKLADTAIDYKQRCEELEAENQRLGQQCEGLMQAGMNNGQALILAEAKLAKAVEALSYYADHDILYQYDDASLAKDAIAELRSDLPVDKTRESQKGQGDD